MTYELCRRELRVPGWALFCVLYKSHRRTDEPHKFQVPEHVVSQSENFGRRIPATADSWITT